MRTALMFWLAGITALAGAAVPDFLPPDTRMVIGFSIAGIVNSPLAATLADVKVGAARLLGGSPLAGLGPLASLDPLKDIDEVVLAATV